MAKRITKANLPAIASRTNVVVAGHRVEAAYRVPILMAKAPGPWQREFDRLAWTDHGTGLPCIIRRMRGGFLAGFVAVPAGHPLYGFSADAVPATLIRVHGRIDYAQPCDQSGPEAVSICHVRSNAVGRHDDAWWFGFSCDQVGDLVPDDSTHAHEGLRLGIQQIYRDERFVFDRCTELAHDLALVGESL